MTGRAVVVVALVDGALSGCTLGGETDERVPITLTVRVRDEVPGAHDYELTVSDADVEALELPRRRYPDDGGTFRVETGLEHYVSRDFQVCLADDAPITRDVVPVGRAAAGTCFDGGVRTVTVGADA